MWYCRSVCYSFSIIQIYSGITSGRVLDWELLYTKILEVIFFDSRIYPKQINPLESLCIILLLLYCHVHNKFLRINPYP